MGLPPLFNPCGVVEGANGQVRAREEACEHLERTLEDRRASASVLRRLIATIAKMNWMHLRLTGVGIAALLADRCSRSGVRWGRQHGDADGKPGPDTERNALADAGP